MNIPLNLNDSTDRARETYGYKTERMTLDTALPEAARELAEKSVAETRKAYQRSKSGLEAALDTLVRSFDSLSQGSAALNRKIIEIAHRNVSSGFDLARSLATARNLGEVVGRKQPTTPARICNLACFCRMQGRCRKGL